MGMSIRAWTVIAAAVLLSACDAGPSAVVHDGDGKAPKPARPAPGAPTWAEVNASASANPHASPFAPAPVTEAAASSSAAAIPDDVKQRDLAVAAAYPPLPTGAKAEISETKYGDWPLWSKTRKLSPAENSRNAFDKHGQEVGAKSYEDYMAMVHAFIHTPPKGTETMTRLNGDVLMYNAKADVFAVTTKTGAPRTLFRPFDGQAYWQKQQAIEAARANGGGSGADAGE